MTTAKMRVWTVAFPAVKQQLAWYPATVTVKAITELEAEALATMQAECYAQQRRDAYYASQAQEPCE